MANLTGESREKSYDAFSLLFLMAKDYHVPVYGIAFQDQTADTARYIQEMGSPYSKIGLDQNGRTAIDFGVTGVPETFILDKNGYPSGNAELPLDPEAQGRMTLAR